MIHGRVVLLFCNYRSTWAKKSAAAAVLVEEASELTSDLHVGAALDLLAFAPHPDQAGLAQFLQVVRNGAGRDLESSGKISDAGGISIIVPGPRRTALLAQAKKYGQTVR